MSAKAIATVVFTRGSSYRKAGAKMFIGKDSRTIGSVSGGCLEADVTRRATSILQGRAPELVVYDTTADQDILLGSGLGCQGVVGIFIEPLSQDKARWLSCHRHVSNPLLVVTVIGVHGEAGNLTGCSRLLILPSKPGVSHETAQNTLPPQPTYVDLDEKGFRDSCGFADERLNQAVKNAAESVFTSRRSEFQTLHLAENSYIDLFFDYQKPTPKLCIFGAGNDAQPLVAAAKGVGFLVAVIDHRQTYLSPERFGLADRLICSRPEDLSNSLAIESNSLVAVMTHNFNHDLEILAALAPTPLAYLGVLGPRTRTLRLLEALATRGIELKSLDYLYTPMGLDLGGEGPEAIALATVAEMQAVLHGRPGISLRNSSATPPLGA